MESGSPSPCASHNGREFDPRAGPFEPPANAPKTAARAFVMMSGTDNTRRAIRAFVGRAAAKWGPAFGTPWSVQAAFFFFVEVGSTGTGSA
jgi:hypothetical protein